MTSLSWAKLKGLEARQEKKEAIMLKMRFVVIVLIWFSVGIITGRSIESFVLGNLF